MNLFSHSTGENRLLGRTLADFKQTTKTSTRGAQVSATPTQQTFTNRTPVGSANYAIPLTQPSTYGTVSKASQIVPKGYSYLNDPTYIGNLGPSVGESWTGGTMRSDGTMAGGSNANPYMTIEQQAQAYADALVKPPEDPAISRDFNAENMAKEQAKQAYYAKLQADTVQKRADAERKYKQMLASNQQTTQEAPTQPTPIQPTPPTQVASTGTGAINAQTQPDLTMQGRSALRGEMRSKQDFIEQKRAEGMSDAQIRQALAVLPPDTFKTSTQQTPPPTPSPTPQPTPTGGKGTQGAPEQQNVPPPVTIPPNAQAIGDALYKAAVASGDPLADLRKAIYDSDVLREEQAKQNALISLGASIQGAEQEYTDTQAYIDKWAGIATQNSDKLTNLLQTQNEETNKVLEQQKSNTLQKLEFDKQVQTQQLEKQKAQDVLKSSIAIALRGGAYSGAAQESLASAEREWDIGIQNLAKEFSFKVADVTTDFTSKYVTAKQNLALNLYNASQELSNKIEGYANAGFASLQAKKKAITEARNSYRTTIDKIQEDHSKDMKTMTKEMATIFETNAKAKRDGMMSTKDKLGYVTSLQSTISQNKIINQAKDVDGFYGALQAGYEGYKGLLADIESGKVSGKDVSLNPSQSAVITSLAHMLDPNSTVRNDEYERQVLGQSAFNIIGGWLEKLNAGGSGLTQVDITSMKNLADGLHQKWEEKLSAEMQPTIANIQDWNTNYPDAQIRYEQVLPVDRIHLPSQTMQRMTDLANGTGTPVSRSSLNPSSTLTDFFSVYAPSADSNNPVAYASSVAKDLGVTPNTPIGELADKIDEFAQAIAKHEGFADGSSRLAVVNNNPGNLKFIGQKGAVMGEKGFAKFNSVADGYTALRNDILAKIGKSNSTIASKPPKTSEPFSLIPKASAAEPQGFTLNADVGPMSPQEVAKRKKEAEFMAKFYPNK